MGKKDDVSEGQWMSDFSSATPQNHIRRFMKLDILHVKRI